MLLSTAILTIGLIHQTAIKLEAKYGIEAQLTLAIIETESNFNIKATGKAKERGLLQLHPRYHKYAKYDIISNMEQGVSYLSSLRSRCYNSRGSAWFTCYNTGPYKYIRNPKKLDYYKKVIKRQSKWAQYIKL